MKKILFVLSLFFISVVPIFASSSDIDLLEYKIQEVKINNKVLEDGTERVKGDISELEKKYAEYNSALDNYLKQVKLKEDAYDLALNQIKYWASGMGLLLAFLVYLGFKDLKEFKNDLSSQLRTKVEDIFTKTDHAESRKKVVAELSQQLGIEDLISEKLKSNKNNLTIDSLLENAGFIQAIAQELFDDSGKLKSNFLIKESNNTEERVQAKLSRKKSNTLS